MSDPDASRKLELAEERLRRLHALAADLSTASTIHDVGRVLLDAAMGALGADVAAFWKVEGDVVVLVAQAAHRAIEQFATVSLEVVAPITHAIRTREPL